MKCRKLLAGAVAICGIEASAQSPSSSDLWDVTSGTVITDHTGFIPGYAPEAAFGLFGHGPAGWTYFLDGQPAGFTHRLEWRTSTPVSIGLIRIFAFGDDFLNNGREFDQVVIKAKSPGSADYDITLLTYSATHPYTFVDAATSLVINQAVSPVTAQEFRAEFLQRSAGYGWDGPRIVEIDAFPAPPPPPVVLPPTGADAWDISQGATVTASSALIPNHGPAASIFGYGGQNVADFLTWTYFADGQPAGAVHFVEWETPEPIALERIRAYAFGDAALNFGREFNQLTIKAKSLGSSDYDVTALTFIPNHPYTFIDPANHLILDAAIEPVHARHFRAEVTQYSAGLGFDGPRIVELDGFGSVLPPPPPPPADPGPVIAAQPKSVAVNFHAPLRLAVDATGSGNLSYQWFKDGAAIEGATASTFKLGEVNLSDAGTYKVVITDDDGSIESDGATVQIDITHMQPSFADLWDVSSGIMITNTSGFHPAGAPTGMFGDGNASADTDVTYFQDGQPAGTGHYLEWTALKPVNVKSIRLFAWGNGAAEGNAREFNQVTLRARTPGSETFDVVLGTFTPTHTYTFLDEATAYIYEADIHPVRAASFRAEFEQFGENGPRIAELDAFTSRPQVVPAIVAGPQSQTVGAGDSVTLNVQARGGNLHYRWKRNGKVIQGARSDTLTIPAVGRSSAGEYTVEVSNDLGQAVSAPAVVAAQ